MSTREERTFFDAFDAAVAGDVAALSPWLKQPAPGFSVYRNTIASGSVGALAATFTTVQLMTGEEWFRAAAREFSRAHPPVDPALLRYGETFPDWLANFPPAADTPYLAGIAHLDWLWWQSWSAADATALDGVALARLTAESLGSVKLDLHPAVRTASFETGIPSLWLAHQAPLSGEPHLLSDAPERILFTRPGLHVQSHLVDAATFAFLDALQRGSSILVAAEGALVADPTCSLPDILAGGIALGLFSSITPIPDPSR